MYCRQCGNELTETNKFCPKCGTPVKQVETVNKTVKKANNLPTIIIIIIVIMIVIICALNMIIIKPYQVSTNTGNVTIKVNEFTLNKAIKDLEDDNCTVLKNIGVIYKNEKAIKYLLVRDSKVGKTDDESALINYFYDEVGGGESRYFVSVINAKNGKLESKNDAATARQSSGVEYVLNQAANNIMNDDEEFCIITYGEYNTAKKQSNINVEKENTNMVNTSNLDNNSSNNITGIEQAIKDGMLGEDYLTKGVSESQLYFAFTDGNLQMYYDSWEECLADAKKLNIITSNEEYLTMEEVLDKENGIK